MHRLFRTRLLWMFDNQPQAVKDLLDRRDLAELENQITNKMFQAHQFQKQLEKQGDQGQPISQVEAEDESVRAILAPAREFDQGGQEETNPLSEKDQDLVIKLLEEREEQEEREEERRAGR